MNYDGGLCILPSRCVICEKPYFGGKQFTCSDACHRKFIEQAVARYGKFKIVIRASTGEAFRVPTRDILEKGLREEELEKYPRFPRVPAPGMEAS